MPKKIFAPEKIVSIKREFVTNILVYDLGIEIDHNYCAEGVAVHNCITETNAMFNDGYLLACKEGEFVTVIVMPDACDYCDTELRGQIFKVRKEPAPDYSTMHGKEREKWEEIWETEVWAYKRNIGRSASNRKRINPLIGNKENNLREKEHHEYSMPACPAHPSCRCRWIRINPEYQYVNKDGQIKLRVENEDEWQEWYEENNIKPIIKGKHGD